MTPFSFVLQKNVLPDVINRVQNGQDNYTFNASLKDSPSYQPVKDISGFVSKGLVGGEYYSSYTGSWRGDWNIASQSSGVATVNFSGNNPTTLGSNVRMPAPDSWRYGQGGIVDHVANNGISGLIQSPIKSFEWNSIIPSVQFQSPIVPFSTITENPEPFGHNGPFRAINQHYDFQIAVPIKAQP